MKKILKKIGIATLQTTAVSLVLVLSFAVNTFAQESAPSGGGVPISSQGIPSSFSSSGSSGSTTTFPATTSPVGGGTSGTTTTFPATTPPVGGGTTGTSVFPSTTSPVGGGTVSSTGSGYCSGASTTILASSSKLSDVIKYFTCLIESFIIPLLFAAALAVFIWGMVKFITSQASAEKEDGKQFMLWGIIALAVMFSVWGLVNIFQVTFGVTNAIPHLTPPTGT